MQQSIAYLAAYRSMSREGCVHWSNTYVENTMLIVGDNEKIGRIVRPLSENRTDPRGPVRSLLSGGKIHLNLIKAIILS